MRRADTPAIPSLARLVTEYCKTVAAQDELEKRRCELRDKLVMRGPGYIKGLNPGEQIQVVEPAPKIATPPDETLDRIRTRLGEEKFNKLWEPRWYPIKAFRAVLGAICKPKQAREILSSCEIEGSAYVRVC